MVEKTDSALFRRRTWLADAHRAPSNEPSKHEQQEQSNAVVNVNDVNDTNGFRAAPSGGERKLQVNRNREGNIFDDRHCEVLQLGEKRGTM